MSAMRRFRHWCTITVISISAMLSQLPCLGVGKNSKRSHDALALSGGNAPYSEVGFSSALCLAALRVDDGSTTLAAAVLADAHTSLLAIVVREPQASAWRKAAIWHSHDTHAALLHHLQEHGVDPQVERALRAGCVNLNVGSVARH